MKRKTLKNNVVTKVVAGLLAVVVFLGSGAVTQAEEEERIMEPGLRFGVRPAPYRFPEPLGERPQAVLIVPQVRYRDFDLGIRRRGMLLQPKSRPLPAQPERRAEHRHGGKEQAAPSASSGRGF